MIRSILAGVFATVSAFSAPLAHSQTGGAPVADKNNPAEVLAYQGNAVLTQSQIDAAFTRIPEQHRLMFIRDGAKVDQLVRSLLHANLVASDARAAGFDQEPLVAERVRQAMEKELAEAWIEELARRSPEADYEAMAREDYLAHPDRYSTPPSLDLTHILISTDERSDEEARALATELKARIDEDPEQFDELVEDYSDDPAKTQNQGRYQNMRKGQMTKEFEKEAFALETAGEVSDPVRTEYGYHLIRLDKKNPPIIRPWEKVKDEAVAAARQRHVENYRGRYLQALYTDPIVFPEGSVDVMARRHFGDNLEKAPQYRAVEDD